jgi:hypothetical protein
MVSIRNSTCHTSLRGWPIIRSTASKTSFLGTWTFLDHSKFPPKKCPLLGVADTTAGARSQRHLYIPEATGAVIYEPTQDVNGSASVSTSKPSGVSQLHCSGMLRKVPATAPCRGSRCPPSNGSVSKPIKDLAAAASVSFSPYTTCLARSVFVKVPNIRS